MCAVALCGSTFDSVAYETLFHDIPVRAKTRTLPEGVLSDRAHTRLDTNRDITLAALRAPELARWNISRTALIESSPKLYKETAAWAERRSTDRHRGRRPRNSGPVAGT